MIEIGTQGQQECEATGTIVIPNEIVKLDCFTRNGMRFEIITPSERLKKYVKHFVISENGEGATYKVFPSTNLVVGFQYRGTLANIVDGAENTLSKAGVTGIQNGFRIFKNSPLIGSILVVFKETGASHFFKNPLNELFSQSVGLDNFMSDAQTAILEERLAKAATDIQRIAITEAFLLSQLREDTEDKMVAQAITHIREADGEIRISTLNKLLHTSASPLEKRFRAIVGASPKKFSSIVRFQAVLKTLQQGLAPVQTGYENNYFDQAHFIKDFKAYTGETPERFARDKRE